MRGVQHNKLAQLQHKAENIRNICILAHVDHGKTTLADSLLASNGIISQRMAGTLRAMDSREDEQQRGITMKSSAISLYYEKDSSDYLINLIDSPGHIDFSSEVSTAVRLCDGAIVVVDAVEGVCPQTVSVLKQAWLEGIKPILLINKIDRLRIHLRLEPMEAYNHLVNILENVNAVTGQLFVKDVMDQSSAASTTTTTSTDTTSSSVNNADTVYDWTTGLEDQDDSNLYFSPDQGNVVFGSAIDCWGFGIGHFAEIYAKKLGMNEKVLRKTLWGDFYLEKKRIKKGARKAKKEPLFVQLILKNLWSIYEAATEQKDKERLQKIATSLDLNIKASEWNKKDLRLLLQMILGQWLPISRAVLDMVVSQLPSPLHMADKRIEKLLCPPSRRFDSLPQQTQQLKAAFESCSASDDAPVIVFVSKMVGVDPKDLPQTRQRVYTREEMNARSIEARENYKRKQAGEEVATYRLMTEEERQTSEKKKEDKDTVFVAFARVFSGTVKQGQPLYVLGPKHDPTTLMREMASRGITDPSSDKMKDLLKHVTPVTVQNLYMFMGRSLEALDSIPAGNILGIGGLECVLKSATLSDQLACPSFADMHFEAAPIVQVAVEPVYCKDMAAMVRGMALLYRSDPCVEIRVQETGEHVIIAAGEVHLNKCITDLTKLYAKVEVEVSAPIVPFRETIIPPPKMDRVNEEIVAPTHTVKKPVYAVDDSESEDEAESQEDTDEKLEEGVIRVRTPDKQCTVHICAKPLPEETTKLLDQNAQLIKTLQQCADNYQSKMWDDTMRLDQETKQCLVEFKAKLQESLENDEENGEFYKGAIDKIWCFGPRRNGPNILLNNIPEYQRTSLWSCLEAQTNTEAEIRRLDHSITCGFQMATLNGPMCEEQMMGVCFSIEKWEVPEEEVFGDSEDEEEEEDETEEVSSRRISESLQEIGRERKYSETIEEETQRERRLSESLAEEVEKSCNIKETIEEKEEEEEETVEEKEDREDSADEKDQQDKKSEDQPKRVGGRSYGPLSGQLLSVIKAGCRQAFQAQPQRLLIAMYSCDIQCTMEVLGKMYAVMHQRGGDILESDMEEGSANFLVKAELPVIESFGFADDIRKRTSGLASPQLKFSHWKVLELDPYWVPTTEEELLHFGEKADSENKAQKYLNSVRRRKGLKVKEKLVEFGAKQRTLKKNK